MTKCMFEGVSEDSRRMVVMKNEKIKSNLGLSLENDSSSHLANCVYEGVCEDLGYRIG